MRIALTTNFSPWSAYSGGGQRSTHQLACALSGRGHEVTVIYTKAPLDKISPPYDLPYQILWAPFFGLRSSRSAPLRPLNAISVRRAVANLCTRLGLDVVHCQGEEGALLGGLRSRFKFGLVVTPRYPWYPKHLHPGHTALEQARLWVFDAKYPVLGQLVHAADKVCPTSASAGEGVRHAYGISEDKIEVIPNGINQRFWQLEWSGATGSQTILFFGRLADDKGIDTLLDAVVDIDRPIHIIGRGEREQALRNQSERLGISHRVTWTSWCEPDELAREVAAASVVVLPSRHESFGNVMAETLAIGTPLVTTNAGSIPEVVGKYASMVPVGDVKALSEAIKTVLDNPDAAQIQSQAGRKWVKKRFHWHEVAARFEVVYEESISIGGSATFTEG
jgi:glycosyltransferase involved in cell wall biosynthesis